MKKIIGIYKITNPNGKVYIGQSKNILLRWKYHYRKYHCKNQKHLYNSLIKYGYENHKFEILEMCEINSLDVLEIYYIEKYNSTDKNIGLNHRAGGNGRIVSIDTIELMRANAVGNKNMLGKHHSKESRLLMSKNRTGIKPSEDTKKKMSESRIGKKHSEETKNKLSNANKFTRKVKNMKTNIEYNSITTAAIKENVNQSTIYRWLKNGKFKYI